MDELNGNALKEAGQRARVKAHIAIFDDVKNEIRGVACRPDKSRVCREAVDRFTFADNCDNFDNGSFAQSHYSTRDRASAKDS